MTDRYFDVIGVSEAARIAHVSEASIRRRIASGALTAFRLKHRGPWQIPTFALGDVISEELLRVAETATRATGEQVPS